MKNFYQHYSALIIALLCLSTEAVEGRIETTNKDPSTQMIERFGGLIRRPDAMTGKVIFLNSQKSVSSNQLKDVITQYGRSLRVPVEILSSDLISMENAIKASARKSNNITIFIVDDNDWDIPMLIAPEKGSAIVNVAPLKENAKSDAYLVSRVKKEIVRAALYVCGGANSQYDNSLMKAIRTPKDLDMLMNTSVPMDVVTRTVNYLPFFGISPNSHVSYLRACREGWAPAPTNEYQKAIWDKVHAMPTAPIKIKPETKKVRE